MREVETREERWRQETREVEEEKNDTTRKYRRRMEEKPREGDKGEGRFSAIAHTHAHKRGAKNLRKNSASRWSDVVIRQTQTLEPSGREVSVQDTQTTLHNNTLQYCTIKNKKNTKHTHTQLHSTRPHLHAQAHN